MKLRKLYKRWERKRLALKLEVMQSRNFRRRSRIEHLAERLPLLFDDLDIRVADAVERIEKERRR
jgi:hypothetical protein